MTRARRDGEVMNAEKLDRINLESFARRIAAKKMGLDGSANGNEREGHNLPDDVWQQSLPAAQRWLEFRVIDLGSGYSHCTVSGTCPADATVKEVEERFFHWYFGGRGAWVKDGKFGCTIHTD